MNGQGGGYRVQCLAEDTVPIGGCRQRQSTDFVFKGVIPGRLIMSQWMATLPRSYG